MTERANLPETLEEFRLWHACQPEVWEFIDGVPRRIAPGSKAHTLIKSNVGGALREALRGSACSVLIDGAIVEVAGSSLIPDVVVTCDPLDFSTPRVDAPVIIVEVMSPASERDDVGRKLALYLQIPSLRHHLVIEQDRRQIIHHERRDDLDGMFLTNIAPPDPLRLEPPGVRLAFAAVYEGVPLT